MDVMRHWWIVLDADGAGRGAYRSHELADAVADQRPDDEVVEVVRAAAYRGAVERLAADGDFTRWAELQHLDRRNGTHEARDAIAAFLGGQ